ncbi:type VI secretion system accessory protein TagJ [Oxalobacteraceae bacterium A2-2]
MTARQLIQDGNLAGALAALQAEVRKNAADAKLRIFLFQLLCVRGDWARALAQLNVVGELDAGALPMVQTYREAIQCEALRAAIFAGQRAPLIFGEPQPWLAQLIDALQHDVSDPERAAAARAQAFEAAPASTGSVDGTPFAWLADADPRLGPVLEAIVNGRYFWIPLCRIRRIELDPPADLRDTVWSAATFTWANGAQTVGLIPTRYPGTIASADDGLLLARRTEWVVHGAGEAGLGQRMFATDSADYALMDVRVIDFDAGPEDGAGLDGQQQERQEQSHG